MKHTEKYVRLIPWEAEALYQYLKALGFPSIQTGFGNKRWAQETREVYYRLRNSRKISDQELVISILQAQVGYFLYETLLRDNRIFQTFIQPEKESVPVPTGEDTWILLGSPMQFSGQADFEINGLNQTCRVNNQVSYITDREKPGWPESFIYSHGDCTHFTKKFCEQDCKLVGLDFIHFSTTSLSVVFVVEEIKA